MYIPNSKRYIFYSTSSDNSPSSPAGRILAWGSIVVCIILICYVFLLCFTNTPSQRAARVARLRQQRQQQQSHHKQWAQPLSATVEGERSNAKKLQKSSLGQERRAKISTVSERSQVEAKYEELPRWSARALTEGGASPPPPVYRP